MRRAALTLALSAAACNSGFEARLDGALLPETDGRGADPAPSGPTLVVRLETDEPALAIPTGATVRLAIDRKVPWRRVAALVDRVRAAGATPIFLVGDRDRVRSISLNDPLDPDEAIRLHATTTGKACVGPPGSAEMRCMQGYRSEHIQRVLVRNNVFDAVKAYQRRQVAVTVEPELQWADVVRAVDGARTCCGKERLAVALVAEPASPAN